MEFAHPRHSNHAHYHGARFVVLDCIVAIAIAIAVNVLMFDIVATAVEKALS